MKHLLTMNELSTGEMEKLLDDARKFKKGFQWKESTQRFVSNLFFEASTRTKSSFEVAERRLGLEVLAFEASSSSITKGETLYDTVKTFEALGTEILVIRHPKDHYYEDLLGKTDVSIINGGDGSGHHPSQSLLDLMTIQEEFGGFKGLHISIVGDIAHSRVARSNLYALKQLGAEVSISGPKEWIDDSFEGAKFIDFDEAVRTSDVLMMLRIQHERHDGKKSFNPKEYHQSYGLTKEREKKMKPKSIIMHPAPVNRDVEIADTLVESDRSRIFRQMENGVYVRMSILYNILQSKRGN